MHYYCLIFLWNPWRWSPRMVWTPICLGGKEYKCNSQLFFFLIKILLIMVGVHIHNVWYTCQRKEKENLIWRPTRFLNLQNIKGSKVENLKVNTAYNITNRLLSVGSVYLIIFGSVFLIFGLFNCIIIILLLYSTS